MKGNAKRIHKLANTLPNYHGGKGKLASPILAASTMKARGPKLYKKQRHSGEIQEADFKFMYANPTGDSDFNADHNKRVIEETIKKTKKREAELKKQYLEQVEERVDAGVSFLKALATGKYISVDSNTAAMRYFGRKELARLRGEEIKRELMAKISMAAKLTNN